MARIHKIVEPFGEVNVYPVGKGRIRVVATIKRVGGSGRVLDQQGQVLKDYAGTGLPAVLDFEVPLGTAYFTLEFEGRRIHQPVYERAKVPPPEVVSTAAPAPPIVRPASALAQKEEESVEEASAVVGGDEDELWKLIDLRPAGQDDSSGDIQLECPQNEP